MTHTVCSLLLLATLTLFAGSIRNDFQDDFRLTNALNALDTAIANFSTTSSTPASPVQENELRTSRLRPRYSEGTLRLVGGRGVHEGNVEIFHIGRWGAICDDEWDIREATVICRQLGFTRAHQVTENSQFGLSRKRVWMDNVYCNGDERNITDCRFDGWGAHDCTQREGAGVVCFEPRLHETTTTTTTTEMPTTILENDTLTNNTGNNTQQQMMMRDSNAAKVSIRAVMTGPMQVRLMGGRVREEGRVEVRFGDGSWGLVCGDGWGMLEANVVCKMLGLGYAQAPVQSNFFGGLHLGMILSGVKCSGREISLADCLHDQMGWAYCPGRAENIAGVMCTDIAPDLILDYQEIERSAYLEDRQLFFLQCAMEENCMAKSAYPQNREIYGWQLEVRRLLRFTAKSKNIGTADFRPVIPKEMWQWHHCHLHYHSMEVFAHFDIIDGRGKRVAEGHKASFCLEDNQCDMGIQPKYACANYGDQGISVGCTDTYLHNVDCQWIDITDVAPGYYFLKISINPEFKIPEMSYENNAALCSLYYNSLSIHVWNCTMMRP
uniref:protein-lysine 6-oxidase n=1 Tax=Strigamia maritima TaxID=126957 RepID=T1IIV9_STRMM